MFRHKEHNVLLVKNAEKVHAEQQAERELYIQSTISQDMDEAGSLFCGSHTQIMTNIAQELQKGIRISRQVKRLEISPSGTTRQELDTKKEALPSLGVDSVLNKYKMYTAFGTYCHYLLSFLSEVGVSFEHLPVMPLKLETQLLPLSPQEKQLFIHDAQTLVDNFVHNFFKKYIGETVSSTTSSPQVYTEYPFLLYNNTHGVWIRGIVDLLIVTDDECIIVDYKVDRYKKEEQYKHQMATYTLAIETQIAQNHIRGNHSNSTPLRVRTVLYYLRSGETLNCNFDISEDDLVQFLLEGKDTAEEEQNISVVESIVEI